MKSFLIKAPARGKTTCTLVRQFYDKASRRTKTQYLGSFNVALDPSKLPEAVRLRPDVLLSLEQLTEISDWLKQFGTFWRPKKLPDEVLEQARQYLMEERHHELITGPEQSDFDVSASTLTGAALELQQSAEKLRSQGVELSPGMLNYTGIDASKCSNDLDRLKVYSNRIRAAAASFEEAMKEAKLMKRLNKAAKVDTHVSN